MDLLSQDTPINGPTGWSPAEIAVWVVLLIVFLVGGGGALNAYLQRMGFFNEREKESWDRIKLQLDEQQEVIDQQDARIARQNDKLDEHFTTLTIVQQRQFDERASHQAQLLDFQKGLYEERENGKQMRALFDSVTKKLDQCMERDEAKAVEIAALSVRVAELHARTKR